MKNMKKLFSKIIIILVSWLLLFIPISLMAEQNSDDQNETISWKKAEKAIKKTLKKFPNDHLAAIVETVSDPECPQTGMELQCRMKVRVIEYFSYGSNLGKWESGQNEFYILSEKTGKAKSEFKPVSFIFIGGLADGYLRALGGNFITSPSETTQQNIEKVRGIINNLLQERKLESCDIQLEPGVTLEPPTQCLFETLRERCGPGDACIVKCFASGGAPNIGGGCWHICEDIPPMPKEYYSKCQKILCDIEPASGVVLNSFEECALHAYKKRCLVGFYGSSKHYDTCIVKCLAQGLNSGPEGDCWQRCFILTKEESKPPDFENCNKFLE
jgi:hypothetical protein